MMWQDAVFGFVAAFALTMGVLNWLSWRRYLRLNELLQHLCTQAWLMQRWPLIDQWMDHAGLEMKVRLRERRP